MAGITKNKHGDKTDGETRIVRESKKKKKFCKLGFPGKNGFPKEHNIRTTLPRSASV